MLPACIPMYFFLALASTYLKLSFRAKQSLEEAAQCRVFEISRAPSGGYAVRYSAVAIEGMGWSAVKV